MLCMMGGGMEKSEHMNTQRNWKLKIENSKRKTSSFCCDRKGETEEDVCECNYFLIKPKNYRSAHEWMNDNTVNGSSRSSIQTTS